MRVFINKEYKKQTRVISRDPLVEVEDDVLVKSQGDAFVEVEELALKEGYESISLEREDHDKWTFCLYNKITKEDSDIHPKKSKS